MVRVNSSIQSRIRARQNSQPNLMERAHKQWKNLHPVVKAAIWAGIGYMAVQGIGSYGNQGFINDVVFVPIIEEIFYRGAIQQGIKKGQEVWNRYQGTKMDETSTRNRVLASSIIFGAAHSGLKNQIEHTWNLGRGTGYLYEKTGSLFAPISLHMTHNLIANTGLRNYIYQGMDYPVLFYLLGKKILPIPDCITKPISSAAGKVMGWFTGKQEEPKKTEN